MYNRGSIPPLPLELWLGYLYDYGPQDPNHYYLAALLTVHTALPSTQHLLSRDLTRPVSCAVRAVCRVRFDRRWRD
jgi:hypothetical protein